MASPTQWTWVWVSSRSCWWAGKPGVLQFMGWQGARQDWGTELNWTKFIHKNCRKGWGHICVKIYSWMLYRSVTEYIKYIKDIFNEHTLSSMILAVYLCLILFFFNDKSLRLTQCLQVSRFFSVLMKFEVSCHLQNFQFCLSIYIYLQL